MNAALTAATLGRARALLAAGAGIATDERHDAVLEAAIDAARRELGLQDADETLAACERDRAPGGALDVLARSLRVRETHVFRTRQHFDALETVVFPEILARRASQRRLVAWSAGCATGEETWSVAFALTRAAAATGVPLSAWDVVVLGTDVDASSVEAAREGEYREYSFRGTSPHEREMFFTQRGSAWRVKDELRRLVTFRRHDLVREPPPAFALQADLVLCRNVLMYFTPEASARVLASLAGTLSDGGWLLVGAAEHGLVRDLPLHARPLQDAIAYRRALEAAPERAVAPAPASARGLVAPASRDPLDGARAALAAGDAARAADVALAVAEADPSHAGACALLGRLAGDAGRTAEAEAWLRRALALRPADPEASYLLALVLAARGAEGAGEAVTAALAALATLGDDVKVALADNLPAGRLKASLAAMARGAAVPARGGKP